MIINYLPILILIIVANCLFNRIDKICLLAKMCDYNTLDTQKKIELDIFGQRKRRRFVLWPIIFYSVFFLASKVLQS